MKPDEQERIFLAKVRAVLEQDIDNLDGAAASRLYKMRRAALDRRGGTGIGLWKLLRVPAAAVAAAAVIILAASLYFKSPVELSTFHSIEDMEILSSGARLDMYMELDFYTWLALEQRNAG